MVIKTSLTKDQFIRVTLLRHVQRKLFYFYAFTCAGATAFAIVYGTYLYLILWIPFIIYILAGVIGAFRAGADKDQPAYLPTRYEFTEKGVSISTSQGSSQLEWEEFSGWNILAKCYVLVLLAGPILAIPQSAVSITQLTKFEALLKKHIAE